MEEFEFRFLEGDAPADVLLGAMMGDVDGLALAAMLDEMAGREEWHETSSRTRTLARTC